MKKIVIAVLFLLMPLTALASGKGSFMDISFGTSHAEVLKRLGEQKNKSYSVDDRKRSIAISDFTLADEKMSVLLLFDHKDRLYSFEYHTQPYASAQFGELKPRADNLTTIFKSIYGQPAGCSGDPQVSQITEGRIYPLCTWDDNDLVIFTGYMAGRENCPSPDGICYNAIGSVTSEEMARALNEDMNKDRRRKRH